MRNLLVSISLLSAILLNGSYSVPIDARRLALEASSADWFRWVTWYGYGVAFGCALEVPEVCITIKTWWLFRFRKKEFEENKGSMVAPIAAIGLILIVAGIVLGTYCEGKVADAETELRNHFSEKITAAENTSSLATQDAAKARIETAQLQKDAQGLKTIAATAKRDMVQAQLELARLKGPIQEVRIVNGVARPNPTKALRLRVVLRSDTVIIFPRLPPGESLDWTLFITQDKFGQHQFGTVPKFMPGGDSDSPFGNKLEILYPNSTCTMELTSDERGTTDKGFQGANCTTPPATTSK